MRLLPVVALAALLALPPTLAAPALPAPGLTAPAVVCRPDVLEPGSLVVCAALLACFASALVINTVTREDTVACAA